MSIFALLIADFEEWNYYVDVDKGAKTIVLQVFQEEDNILFSGSAAEMETWLSEEQDE